MKRYPAYKDSGIEWLGEIPEHWEKKRLKYLCQFKNGFAFNSDSYVDEGIAIIRIGDIKRDIDLSQTKKVPKSFFKSHSEFKIEYGDILLALTGATIGKTAVFNLTEDALLNQRVAIVRPQEVTTKAFLKYVIDSHFFKRHIDYECGGGAQDNIGKPEVCDYPLTLPSLPEQTSIADFLDRKTLQIDNLIDKKRRLIELLKEYRTAVITHAVTKGLNPSAKMKDSGIEWIGEIPEGWGVKRMRFAVQLNPSKQEIAHFPKDTEVSFLPMEMIGEEGELYLEDFRLLDEVWEGYTYFGDGDVLIAKITPCFENGKGALARELKNGIGFGTTELHVLRTSEYVDSKFIFYLTRQDSFRKIGEAFMTGAAGQKRIPENFIKNLLIMLPNQNEQNEISRYLDNKTKEIYNLIEQHQKSIEMLNEYKTSIISDVVTGKFDVRQ
ncbi:MAG: restriction endonuclease subunit S [Deltaproteobacteria bacterium]|uniref:Restriction endonuclease subunit S n=1 Tax=Candidatus Zymogenus saltonus TaxID=2844893 RepID=A0A9D8KGH0_9DELT|nr:restriction endonuclease subunit S [Candidatus Zymogenus saltonus]